MARKKRIVLSIDGGGIRGLIPLRILESIESRLVHRGAQRPMHAYFDLICGSSTGGLIAAALAAPKPSARSDEAAATLSDLREFFERDARDIFMRSMRRKLTRLIANPFGFFDETYDARTLEALLKDRFGWTSLASGLIPVVLTAYDVEKRRAVFMTNGTQHDGSRPDDYYFWQAVRATTSLPSFFEPARIDNLTTGAADILIDGSVFMQNPAIAAYIEARKMGWQAEDITVISLGSGKPPEHGVGYRGASGWGAHGWMQPSKGAPILSMTADAQSRTASYQADCLFTDLGEARYIRIDGDIPPEAEAIDNARPGNIIKLNGAADRIIRDNTTLLDEIAEMLNAASG